ESLSSLETRRMRPARSVTSRRPSGRNCNPQGCSSPLAKLSTLILLGSAGGGALVMTAAAGATRKASAPARATAIPPIRWNIEIEPQFDCLLKPWRHIWVHVRLRHHSLPQDE